MSVRSLFSHAEGRLDGLHNVDTRGGAAVAVKAMRAATARVIGGDLRMSGLKRGGPARIEAKRSRNQIVVRASGGSYTLADKGRRRAVPARARGGSALRTPWGPRSAVKGSTTPGHHITERAGPKGLDQAADQIVRDLDWGR